MWTKKWIRLFLLGVSALFSEEFLQNQSLIDYPTAGLLPAASYEISITAFPAGGLLSGIKVGITERFLIGLSYSSLNVVGESSITKNHYASSPGIQVKYRLLEETYRYPALALGIDSQGRGGYFRQLSRYQFKAKGFYLTLSKNYLLLGSPLGLHGGGNYNPWEDVKAKRTPTFFCGLDKSLNDEIFLMAEYDLAWDEEPQSRFSNGYLNAGIHWIFTPNLILGFHFKDILKNNSLNFPEGSLSQLGNRGMSREILVAYFERF